MIAGTARGRRLVTPTGRATRPTADRVKEALFSILHSLDTVDDAR
ncbi:MAG: RsmD family RNA methyltransferase, partial [Trichlorobacter sp.]